jgi:heavy metal sensor kinase
MSALSIRTKLTAWYSMIMVVSLCVFGIAADLALRSSIHSTVDEELRQRIEGVRKITAEEGPNGAEALMDEFQEFADGQGKRGRLRVADSSGKVLFASPGTEFLAVHGRESGLGSSYLKRIGGEGFRILEETISANGSSYDVVVAAAMDDFERAINRFEFALYFSVPAVLIIAALGGYWLSRRALGPVDEITRAARKIGAQDLAQRLTVHTGGDELERLADTLNGMLGRLEAAFQGITKFTADASHELRTPVAVMRASAEITLRKSRTEQEYREALGQILQESERLSKLIEQLLLLARSDAVSITLPMIHTDLTHPLTSACRQASLLAEQKRLTFSERIPEGPLWVQGDSASLERLFLILFENAVKYTPAGGRIDIQLNSENGFAVAAVRDTGIGVSSEDLPHIFERFFRADRSRTRDSGGSGLGLAIGSWIVQLHGGEIRVQSVLSQGSCFEVRLPLTDNDKTETTSAVSTIFRDPEMSR